MIRQSFALRTGLGAAGLMLLASLLSAGWVWRDAEATLRAQLDFVLASEAESLVREYQDFGLVGLAEQVRGTARRRGPIRADLQTADGRTLAGGIGGQPPPLLRGFATLEQPTGGSRLRVLGVLLPAGGSLIVAAELAGLERAAERLGWAPAAASALAAVVALLLGFVAARRLERRLARAGEAARAIMDGDLSRRLPETGAGDEVDRLAVTINLMLSRIEALVEAQRQVTDDIAHDLRTPLSRLRQRIEGALATRRDARADGETLEAALRELDDVLATFGTLLRIARVESGAGRSGFRDLDLSALVGDLAEAYGPVAEEAGRSLAAEIAPGQRLHGDGALLRQAVANLLDNALLHGGPSITLRLRQGPVIEVADDGPGIPPDQRDAVQRRFHRLDFSRNTPGTGLGLALVAAAAQLHGGTLRILDGPGGRGVTALLELHDPQAAAA